MATKRDADAMTPEAFRLVAPLIKEWETSGRRIPSGWTVPQKELFKRALDDMCIALKNQQYEHASARPGPSVTPALTLSKADVRMALVQLGVPGARLSSAQVHAALCLACGPKAETNPVFFQDLYAPAGASVGDWIRNRALQAKRFFKSHGVGLFDPYKNNEELFIRHLDSDLAIFESVYGTSPDDPATIDARLRALSSENLGQLYKFLAHMCYQLHNEQDAKRLERGTVPISHLIRDVGKVYQSRAGHSVRKHAGAALRRALISGPGSLTTDDVLAIVDFKAARGDGTLTALGHTSIRKLWPNMPLPSSDDMADVIEHVHTVAKAHTKALFEAEGLGGGGPYIVWLPVSQGLTHHWYQASAWERKIIIRNSQTPLTLENLERLKREHLICLKSGVHVPLSAVKFISEDDRSAVLSLDSIADNLYIGVKVPLVMQFSRPIQPKDRAAFVHRFLGAVRDRTYDNSDDEDFANVVCDYFTPSSFRTEFLEVAVAAWPRITLEMARAVLNLERTHRERWSLPTERITEVFGPLSTHTKITTAFYKAMVYAKLAIFTRDTVERCQALAALEGWLVILRSTPTVFPFTPIV